MGTCHPTLQTILAVYAFLPCASLLKTRYAIHTPHIHAYTTASHLHPLSHTTTGGILCLTNRVSHPCSHTSASLPRQETLTTRAENIFPEQNPSPPYPLSSHRLAAVILPL